MKKLTRIIVILLFASAYILFLSLGIAALLQVLGIAFAISLDGHSVSRMYPRFIPFCFGIGCVALIGFMGVAITVRICCINADARILGLCIPKFANNFLMRFVLNNL